MSVDLPTPGTRLSYSQKSSWTTCGVRMWHERVNKIASPPSWAQVAGSAIHGVTEAWDLAQYGWTGKDYPTTFIDALEFEIAAAVEKHGFPEAEFKAYGRATKAWPDKENKAWWLHHGQPMLDQYAEWRLVSGWEVMLLDGGQPAVEVEVNLDLGDGVTVLGYIDRLMVTPQGEAVVVDLKSGSREPQSPGQLGFYAYAWAKAAGAPQPKWGGYYMTRGGQVTQLWNLDGYTQAKVEYEYRALAAAKQQGIYLANPGPLCGSCGVRPYCSELGGELAHTVPQPWDAPATA